MSTTLTAQPPAPSTQPPQGPKRGGDELDTLSHELEREGVTDEQRVHDVEEVAHVRHREGGSV